MIVVLAEPVTYETGSQLLRDSIRAEGCPSCHAAPRKPCVTRTGRVAKDDHQERGLLIRQAYSAGFGHSVRGTYGDPWGPAQWAFNLALAVDVLQRPLAPDPNHREVSCRT